MNGYRSPAEFAAQRTAHRAACDDRLLADGLPDPEAPRRVAFGLPTHMGGRRCARLSRYSAEWARLAEHEELLRGDDDDGETLRE